MEGEIPHHFNESYDLPVSFSISDLQFLHDMLSTSKKRRRLRRMVKRKFGVHLYSYYEYIYVRNCRFSDLGYVAVILRK